MKQKLKNYILIGVIWFISSSMYLCATNHANWMELASIAAVGACGGAVCIGILEKK